MPSEHLNDLGYALPRPRIGFILECPHLYVMKGEKGADVPLAICKEISRRTGAKHGITPFRCAQCRRYGEIDQKWIDIHVQKAMKVIVKNCVHGFYNYDPHIFEEVLIFAYTQSKDSRRGRNLLRRGLRECVRAGHIAADDAINLVQTHMPELLKDELPERAEGSGEREVPAEGSPTGEPAVPDPWVEGSGTEA